MFCMLVMVVPRLVVVVVVVVTIRSAWLPPQLRSGLQSLYQGQREGTMRYFSQKCTGLSVL